MVTLKRLSVVLLGLGISVLLSVPPTVSAGTLDPQLLSAKFTPGETVPVVIWLKDQPGYEISTPIKKQHAPALEALAREIREARQTEPGRVPQLTEEINLEHGRMVREIWTAVRQRIGPQQEKLKTEVEKLGGKAGAGLTIVNAVGAVIPSDRLAAVAALPQVSYVEWDRPSRSLGISRALIDTSSKAIGDTTFHDAGYTGTGYDFGLVDMGIKTTIGAFSGKTKYCSPDSFLTGGKVLSDGGVPSGEDIDHGTQVAGIAVGNDAMNPNYKSIAYGVTTIFSAAPGTFGDHYPFDWIIDKGASLDNAAEVINHSRGKLGDNTTDYPSEAKFIDALIDDYDILVTQAIGNKPDDAYPTKEARSYNAIVVGAMNDTNTIIRTDDVLWEYSTDGPTPDGRKKPDLVAPGHKIISPDTSGNYDPPGPSGTSFAAPHVAGGVLLLKDAEVSDSRRIKAILINTAEDEGTAEWDSLYGWGYINLDKAYNQNYSFLETLDNTTAVVKYKGVMSASQKATIVWHKHWTYNTAPGDPTDEKGLSDIDLYLRRKSTNAVIDSSKSPRDNVEQVQYAFSGQDSVIVEIKLQSLGSGLSSETVALAVPRSGYQKMGGSKLIAGGDRAPQSFSLSQNYPNPFNPVTVIPFELPTASAVQIRIYNTLGQVVRTLVDEEKMKIGRHLVVWDGKDGSGQDVASGLYLYSLKAGDFTAPKKMLLLR